MQFVEPAPIGPSASGRDRGLRGRVAIVTGAANGIGRATAKAFSDEGTAVIIADINEPVGRNVADDIRRSGGDALYVRTDTSDMDSVSAMVRAAAKEFGRVDILVNGAAEFIMRGLDASRDQWRRVTDVNIMGYAFCANAASAEMDKSGGGSIVNIGSISGFIAQRGYLTYNATKGAVAEMTRCMALDLAPLNIRVNAVCPATVWTERTEQYMREHHSMGREDVDKDPNYGGKHMLMRTADPFEIAWPIVFLASSDASFITGENLMVDGGYCAQ